MLPCPQLCSVLGLEAISTCWTGTGTHSKCVSELVYFGPEIFWACVSGSKRHDPPLWFPRVSKLQNLQSFLRDWIVQWYGPQLSKLVVGPGENECRVVSTRMQTVSQQKTFTGQYLQYTSIAHAPHGW